MADYGVGCVTFYSPFYNYITAVNTAAKNSHHHEVPDFYRFIYLLSNEESVPAIDIDNRDTIFDASNQVKYHDEHKVWYTEIVFEFAWQIHPDVFHVVCEDIFHGQMHCVYIGAESAGDYFENTDKEGLFYPQRFRAEIQIGNGDSEQEDFETKTELVLWLQELIQDYHLNVQIDESLSLEEMENRICHYCDDEDIEYGVISIAQYE